MIPISKNYRLQQKFYGVNYRFLPPVGDTELFIINSHKEDYTVEQLRDSYNSARADIEKEYIGKKRPVKKIVEKQIEERMRMYLPQSDNSAKIVVDTIDKILVGWDIKGTPFPDDNRPSQCLNLKLMTKMYTWYLEQYNLDEEEVKN
jgi:hypothetical protein